MNRGFPGIHISTGRGFAGFYEGYVSRSAMKTVSKYKSLFQPAGPVGVLLCLTLLYPAVSNAQVSRSSRIAALCDSGFVLLEREEFERAHALFNDALRLDRNSPRALYGMGRAFLGIPKGGSRALEYLTRAVNKVPDDSDIRYYKALAHFRLARTDIIGWDNSSQALKELEKILEINPSHPNAYYLRGQIYRDTFQNYEKTIESFRLQVEVDPSNIDARNALLKALIDVGDWDDAATIAEGSVERDPARWESYPLLAAAYWKAEKPDEGMRTFEKFFAIAPEEERDLYFNLGIILPTVEKRNYSELDEEGRRTYWNRFWRTKDPDPKTAVNERLLEHFIRIAYARIEFGEGDWPWDDRGEMLVRYGEPDIRSMYGRPYATSLIRDDWDFYLAQCELCDRLGLPRPMYMPVEGEPSGMNTRANGSATPEQWYYVDRGLELTFADPVMSGNYLAHEGSGVFKDALERHMPAWSEEEDKIEIFDPLHSAVTFRGEGGKTALEYAIGLLPDDFGQFRSVTGEYAYIDAQMELFTPDWRQVADASSKVSKLATIPQVTIRGNPLFVHGTRMEVEPGDYVLSILILDPESGKRATTSESVTLPDYSGSDLMISDILPAARITEVGPGRRGRFIRGNLEVMPLPGRNLAKDQTLFIYFEVYNLRRDQYGATRYKVEYSVAEGTDTEAPLLRLYQGLKSLVGFRGKQAVLSSESELRGIRRDISTYLEIDMNEPPHGVYTLQVKITDLVSGEEAVSGLTFRTLPPAPVRQPPPAGEE